METITFMTSLLTFYLKGEIKAEQNFLRLKKPNTLLAFIPLGAKQNNVPINQIAEVDTSFKLAIGRLLLGAFEGIFGLSCVFGPWFFLGLLFLLLGASTVINSFQTELSIRTTSGTSYELFFLIFEKSKAEQAENAINAMIGTRMNDTNTRAVTEAQTDALINAISSEKKS
ncbi:MAG: hypothetical protein NC299_07695 [Lachnospiraceae bacterium]|nr:hypothetical protein [Ruminococcus sp.]MCM1275237.1 hypothetical protein [Lachnospiraceae bacterium]